VAGVLVMARVKCPFCGMRMGCLSVLKYHVRNFHCDRFEEFKQMIKDKKV